jgi:hypothetical protein
VKVTIKRISLFSAFKMGCGIYAFYFTFIVLLVIYGAVFSVPAAFRGVPIQNLVTAPFATFFFGLVLGVVAGLVVAMQALLYNLAAMLFGGIQITLKRRVLVEREAEQEIPAETPKPKTTGYSLPPRKWSGGDPVRNEIADLRREIDEKQRRLVELNQEALRKKTPNN